MSVLSADLRLASSDKRDGSTGVVISAGEAGGEVSDDEEHVDGKQNDAVSDNDEDEAAGEAVGVHFPCRAA